MFFRLYLNLVKKQRVVIWLHETDGHSDAYKGVPDLVRSLYLTIMPLEFPIGYDTIDFICLMMRYDTQTTIPALI